VGWDGELGAAGSAFKLDDVGHLFPGETITVNMEDGIHFDKLKFLKPYGQAPA
jgi:hypothetical protein